MAAPRTTAEEQLSLLAHWRKLLQVCLSLHDALDPNTRPPEVALGIVHARSAIGQLKVALREAGEDVADMADELTVADANAIEHELLLLTTYRRNLSILVRQQAQYAGQPPPPVLVNQLVEVRGKLAQIKRRLRDWQVPVDDLPDDVGQPA